MTLWDENINLVDENAADAPVIAVKGARVSDFGGRSLSMARNSMVEMNPDMPAAHALKGWYVNGGKAASFSTVCCLSRFPLPPSPFIFVFALSLHVLSLVFIVLRLVLSPSYLILSSMKVNLCLFMRVIQLSGGGGGSGKDVRKFIADIKGDNLGHGEKPDYFSMRVWVSLSHSLVCVGVSTPPPRCTINIVATPQKRRLQCVFLM